MIERPLQFDQGHTDADRESYEMVHSLLAEQNEHLDQGVRAALYARREEALAEVLPEPTNYFANQLEVSIRNAVSTTGLSIDDVKILPPPRQNKHAARSDLGMNIAKPAIEAGFNPNDAAANIVASVGDIEGVEGVEAVGPFVNFELDFSVVAPRIIDEVRVLGNRYGHFREGEPETVIVDYSSPNIAKNMTVAHLRSTIIGHSLVQIQRAVGNIPFAINHIGDWGTQFGNIIYQYRQEMTQNLDAFTAELEADPTATLMRIYRDFNEKKDPEAISEARHIFLELEQGDPELVKLWSNFREWSLRDFSPTYERLKISFDAIQGESFYEDRMPSVIDDALAKGVLIHDDDGSVVFPSQPLIDPITQEVNSQIMLDQNGEPRNEVIVKPSGGTVYLTRDIAAIYYRARELGASKILYVIGKEQQSHCLELFNIADQLGYIALGNAVHVSFGHLNVDGRKMKSREGKVVLLNDLIDDSVAAAAKYIADRDGVSVDDLSAEAKEQSEQVGIGALVLSDLRQDRSKDIEFNPDMEKTVEAGGVAYIQYTNARLKSVLKNFEAPDDLVDVPELNGTEREVLVEIARLPQVIEDAARYNAPHKIASYLSNFCQRLNNFYNESSVKQAEVAEQIFRLHLIAAALQVIENSAQLLHIELPERM